MTVLGNRQESITKYWSLGPTWLDWKRQNPDIKMVKAPQMILTDIKVEHHYSTVPQIKFFSILYYRVFVISTDILFPFIHWKIIVHTQHFSQFFTYSFRTVPAFRSSIPYRYLLFPFIYIIITGLFFLALAKFSLLLQLSDIRLIIFIKSKK